MLRKIIFGVLALLTALLLGHVLYLTWQSGNIHRNGKFGPYDISAAKQHGFFVLTFCVEALQAIGAVGGLLAMGWGLKGKRRPMDQELAGREGLTAAAATKPPDFVRLNFQLGMIFCSFLSVFFFSFAALFAFQAYQMTANLHVMGRIERTSVVTAPRGNRVRQADITFTVIRDGEPILCQADDIILGDEAFPAQVGDDIELSPIPGSCERPRLLNRAVLWSGPIVFSVFGMLIAMAAMLFRRGPSERTERLRMLLNTDLG